MDYTRRWQQRRVLRRRLDDLRTGILDCADRPEQIAAVCRRLAMPIWQMGLWLDALQMEPGPQGPSLKIQKSGTSSPVERKLEKRAGMSPCVIDRSQRISSAEKTLDMIAILLGLPIAREGSRVVSDLIEGIAQASRQGDGTLLEGLSRSIMLAQGLWFGEESLKLHQSEAWRKVMRVVEVLNDSPDLSATLDTIWKRPVPGVTRDHVSEAELAEVWKGLSQRAMLDPSDLGEVLGLVVLYAAVPFGYIRKRVDRIGVGGAEGWGTLVRLTLLMHAAKQMAGLTQQELIANEVYHPEDNFFSVESRFAHLAQTLKRLLLAADLMTSLKILAHEEAVRAEGRQQVLPVRDLRQLLLADWVRADAHLAVQIAGALCRGGGMLTWKECLILANLRAAVHRYLDEEEKQDSAEWQVKVSPRATPDGALEVPFAVIEQPLASRFRELFERRDLEGRVEILYRLVDYANEMRSWSLPIARTQAVRQVIFREDDLWEILCPRPR